jgi:hypothetical protein
MRSVLVPLASPSLALVLACGGSTSAVSQGDVPQQASAEIGPNGGLVVLPDGSSITVPPRALTHEVTITMEVDPSAPALDIGSPTGLTYLLGPEGQQFDLPVTVKLAIDPPDPGEISSDEAADEVVIYTAPRTSADYVPLTTTFADSLHVSATTTHFSHVVPARAPKKPVLHAGKLRSINIGFNGPQEQFDHYGDFFDLGTTEPSPGPRLCHWYMPWYTACEDASCTTSTPKDLSSVTCPVPDSESKTAPYLACWLKQAHSVGGCEEALISFKGDWKKGEADHSPPPYDHYKNAMLAFKKIPWKEISGFTGNISISPWNEPNNGSDEGNGLGKPIAADRAATYYLIAQEVFEPGDWKVAAGDFASNGNFWDNFEWNCANDDVRTGDLCKKKSPYNTGRPSKHASYLDNYKNHIYTHWHDYKIKAKHPPYFAFHGWHDINVFLEHGSMCRDYSDCVTRRLSESLSGKFWQDLEIWDTETGVGQKDFYEPPKQACGAAFLLDTTAIDQRITRIYYTRLYNANPKTLPQELLTQKVVDGKAEYVPSDALGVLAWREPSRAGHCWSGEKGVPPKTPPSKPPSSATDVCCAVCAGETTAYFAAEITGADGTHQTCAQAAAVFCQGQFSGASVTSAALGTCSIYQ